MGYIKIYKSVCYSRGSFGDYKGDFCGIIIQLFNIKIPLIIRDCIFNDVCKKHDEDYEKLDWSIWLTTSLNCDIEMLRGFLNIAGYNIVLIFQAYIMFIIARTWGMTRWFLSRFGLIW